MTNHDAIQIIGLMAVIAEREGTVESRVIHEAEKLAIKALKEAHDGKTR